MRNNEKISTVHLDVLREIGTIGAGRAATALADLLNCKVEITLPETKLVPFEGLDKVLGSPEELYFVLDTVLTGDVGGRFFFLLPYREGKILGGTLVGKSVDEVDTDDALFQSSLKEMINILAGAYLNSLADMTSLTILYGIPSIALDMLASLLDFFLIQLAQEAEEVIFIKTKIKVEDIHFGGCFLFFPEFESLKKIFEILGVNSNG